MAYYKYSSQQNVLLAATNNNCLLSARCRRRSLVKYVVDCGQRHHKQNRCIHIHAVCVMRLIQLLFFPTVYLPSIHSYVLHIHRSFTLTLRRNNTYNTHHNSMIIFLVLLTITIVNFFSVLRDIHPCTQIIRSRSSGQTSYVFSPVRRCQHGST